MPELEAEPERTVAERRARRTPRYSREPTDATSYRRRFDLLYSRTAPAYDLVVKVVPTWRRWLDRALPFVTGPRVLEVSFGTGYLLTRYCGRVEAHGVDLNARMVALATRNLHRAGLHANLCRANVEALPYPEGCFDTVLCTASFSGYPDGHRALAELLRVMKPDGRLVILDVGYPSDGNRLGTGLTRLWMRAGDLIRDLDMLFREFDLHVDHHEIGAWGSMHLWIVTRASAPPG